MNQLVSISAQNQPDELSNALTLIRDCAAGEQAARARFQEEYGEDIYNFPLKIYNVAEEVSGDFYVYVFEKDRIFTRMRTFKGKNNIQFRTFLSFYVLKHLFLEWRRTQRSLDTVSWDTPVVSTSDRRRGLEEIISGEAGLEPASETSAADSLPAEILRLLSPEEQLDLKLLTLIECDLSPKEVRLLAKLADRTLADTLILLEEVQHSLRRKDEKISQLCDELDSVWGWILLRQKELQEIDEKVLLKRSRKAAVDPELVSFQKTELEHALRKRYRQREKLLEEIRRYKLTTPYKDIAQVLSTTVGTVGSRISRLRERLSQMKETGWVLEERAS